MSKEHDLLKRHSFIMMFNLLQQRTVLPITVVLVDPPRISTSPTRPFGAVHQDPAKNSEYDYNVERVLRKSIDSNFAQNN